MKIDPSDAVLGEKLGRSHILLMLLVTWTMLGQTSGGESRKPTDPLGGSKTLSLNQIIGVVLEHNPMIQSARAKWIAARERIAQAGAWEDLKVGTNIVLGRFVSVPANAFTDQTVSIEQMIPLSGKNRSKERAAAAEALGAFEEARRQELDVIQKPKRAIIKSRTSTSFWTLTTQMKPRWFSPLTPLELNLKLAHKVKPICCWLKMSAKRSSKHAETSSKSFRTKSQL